MTMELRLRGEVVGHVAEGEAAAAEGDLFIVRPPDSERSDARFFVVAAVSGNAAEVRVARKADTKALWQPPGPLETARIRARSEIIDRRFAAEPLQAAWEEAERNARKNQWDCRWPWDCISSHWREFPRRVTAAIEARLGHVWDIVAEEELDLEVNLHGSRIGNDPLPNTGELVNPHG